MVVLPDAKHLTLTITDCSVTHGAQTVSMHGAITIALLSAGTETVTLDVTVDVNDVPWARISGTDNGIAVRHADGSELSSAESQAFGNLFGLPRAIEFAIESLFSPCQRLMGA
ncbi:MAG: hypothetical protein DMD57_08375 [Gemmatimonadetes bacterium]|nr:MAG: hypothetical protein DMD57_08375 [Gemmatimonadota bacterium]